MDKIDELLSRGVEKIYPSKEALEKVLRSEKKIKIYLGVDPTGPQVHLGHSTNFLTLRRLQDLGHKIIFLIGDFTGMIGDPTDKLAARKQQTHEEAMENAKTYKDQVSKIIDFEGKNPAEIKFNSEWLGKLSLLDGLNLMSNFTLQQLLERDMFQQRLKEGKPLHAHEITYPMLQAYDSVAMDVDAEMGGSDQTFNMLLGRELIKEKSGKEKFVIVTELLINPATGKKMMSKSEGSFIGLNDSPSEMFGKTLALPDEVTEPIFRMCTNIALTKIDFSQNPLELKKQLAFELVTMYHSAEAAKKAQENWEAFHQTNELSKIELPKLSISALPGGVSGATVAGAVSFLGNSMSQTKNLITQGSVDINSIPVSDRNLKINVGDIIKVGDKVAVKVEK